jgi:hypothetical protein
MGMLFLFGVPTKSNLSSNPAVESKRWFTLFFIPVIPLGGSFLIRCNLCGLTLKCSPELKEQIMPKAMAAGA